MIVNIKKNKIYLEFYWFFGLFVVYNKRYNKTYIAYIACLISLNIGFINSKFNGWYSTSLCVFEYHPSR